MGTLCRAMRIDLHRLLSKIRLGDVPDCLSRHSALSRNPVDRRDSPDCLCLSRYADGRGSGHFFIHPVVPPVLAAIFLGEKVGRLGWAAVLVGFCGVMIIIRPGGGFFTITSVNCCKKGGGIRRPATAGDRDRVGSFRKEIIPSIRCSAFSFWEPL